MYWVSKLLAIAATGALGTNAMEVSIFKFPSGHLESGSVTVSEDFAQLALKMGVESPLASVLHGMEAEVDHLDQFLDTQMPLFGSNHEVPGRSLIILEGLPVEAGMSMRKKHVPNLLVPGASNDLTVKDCLSKSPVLSRDQELFGHDLLDLIDSVETWVAKDQKTTASRLSFKTVSSDKILYIKHLESIFQDLAKLSSTDSWVTTAVLATSEYGSEVRGNISRRAEKSRIEPSDAQNDLQFSPRDLPLHSNLAPVCYASNSSCTDTTNNCSGHGYCYLKYGSGSDATTGNCYACRCQQTIVRKNDGTTQKVQWGGPACQKKDISSPFLLIAGVSVFAVIMVSTAIGMLFSMGQQELPSVIGAGVGGSKAQT
ncbi:hypothetical protein N7454_005080 [Penicillium verhagenii]|nr:hypothetical protein N7454_005080 [Penicillium verhagenii]